MIERTEIIERFNHANTQKTIAVINAYARWQAGQMDSYEMYLLLCGASGVDIVKAQARVRREQAADDRAHMKQQRERKRQEREAARLVNDIKKQQWIMDRAAMEERHRQMKEQMAKERTELYARRNQTSTKEDKP